MYDDAGETSSVGGDSVDAVDEIFVAIVDVVEVIVIIVVIDICSDFDSSSFTVCDRRVFAAAALLSLRAAALCEVGTGRRTIGW